MRQCQYKNCYFPVWGTDKNTGIGYCKYHQFARTDLDRRTLSQKALAKAKDQSRNMLFKDDDETELQKWYKRIMDKEKPFCWETGEWINKEDKRGWHGSIAHILQKALFPSVATHPLNYMILSMWNGSHSNWDSSWEKAKSMKVFPLALKRIEIMFTELKQDEIRRLPQFIIDHINETQPF